MIIWTIVLVGILAFLISKTRHKEIFVEIVPSELFTVSRLDSLTGTNDYVMLIMGADSCNMCDFVYIMPVINNYPVSKYFLKKDYHDNNLLLSQALHTTGFPTSYFLNQDYEIEGMIMNHIDNLDGDLHKILIEKQAICPVSIHGIKDNNVLPMLSFSLKSAICYLQSDFDGVKRNARMSLDYGEYFFNNYMLYSYYKNHVNTDSVDYYKEKALNCLHGGDFIIYKNLIEELEETLNT